MTALYPNSIDLGFVIDTTGTLFDDIQFIKNSSSDIFDAVSANYSGYRIGITGYKDPGQITIFTQFTSDVATLEAAVNAMTAGGGGDQPEGIYSGLLAALDGTMGEWSADSTVHRLVLFGDAPAKDAELREAVNALAQDVTLADVTTTESGYVTDITVMLENDPSHTPIRVEIFTVLVGNNPEAQEDFELIAAENSGRFFHIASASDVVAALIAAVTAPPVVEVNLAPELGEIDASPEYTLGDAALLLDNAIMVCDDHSTIHSATITLGGKMEDSETLTVDVGTSGLVASYNSATGTLTLTGEASSEVYETVMETLSYSNLSPTLLMDGTRTVSYTVNDGEHDSAPLSLTLTLIAPVISNIITGTDTHDFLLGTAQNDVVMALAGHDAVFSGEGNDEVYGGSGQDALFGGQGNDTLLGEAGKDMLKGQGGDDVLDGGEGNDMLFGDTCFFWQLESGNDTLLGGAGHDMLFGNGGADRLEGGEGKDDLHGGKGDDMLLGGAGADLLYGDRGDDVFAFTSLTDSTRTQTDILMDFMAGDIIDLSALGVGFEDLNITAPRMGRADFKFGFFSKMGAQKDTIIRINGTDFELKLDGYHALDAGDFLLS